MATVTSVQSKKWQNLIHKKCPNCDMRLEDSGKFWKCPRAGIELLALGRQNCFFISKEKALDFLTDPTHSANRFLSQHERETLTEGLRSLGIVV